MKFQPDHPILDEFVLELASSFDGNDWGSNGPKLVTRVLQRFCKNEDLEKLSPETCRGIKVLPPEAFYPIPWRQWKQYFDESQAPAVLKKLEGSFIAHVWGKHSSREKFKVAGSAYSQLARDHCPLTFRHAVS